MRLVYVIEVNLKTCEHEKVNIFELPNFGEQGFYRSVVSYDAFFHGMKSKNYDLRRNILYFANFQQDLDIFNTYEDVIALPQTIYKNIWEFYKGIGYNYKKKKYEALCESKESLV